LIKGLANKMEKTIFMCSNILSVVQQLYDHIGIVNQGWLITLGTVDDIIAQTGTKTLEEAFIAMSGGVEEKRLLAWRGQRSADA